MSDTFLNPVTTQTWANGRHIVRCVKVIQETWDVRTFCFMADQPIMFFFKPGQFVTLELEIEGRTHGAGSAGLAGSWGLAPRATSTRAASEISRF